MCNIDAKSFYEILVYAKENLIAKKDYLNALNVFPVPDGDTGSNMSMTFSEAVKSINFNENANITLISKELSKGALMGARGNSGVILSQVLRGLSKSLEGIDEIDVTALKSAIISAKESSYRAVMKPKEGTILSVIRAMSESAEKHSDITDVKEFISIVVRDGNRMLEATREMLPSNKAANTVDAGGAGLMLLFEAFVDVLNGKKIENTDNNVSSNLKVETNLSSTLNIEIKYQYCTEFIIKNAVDELIFRNELDKIGDSVVVVSMDDITKVHVHTNEPDIALKKALAYGELTKIKIENMKEQHNENLNLNQVSPVKEVAIVAVANGDGIVDLFADLNVDYTINVGELMNPSVEDILSASKKINANNVIFLPNNKNIILSAKQAKELADFNIIVIPTTTIPEGIASAIAFNPEHSLDDNCLAMNDAKDNVISYGITTSVKDVVLDGLDIKKGEIISVTDDKVVFKSNDYLEAFDLVFEDSISEDISYITVIYGSNIDTKFIDDLSSNLEEKYSDIDFCFVNGKQEIYSFIISVE